MQAFDDLLSLIEVLRSPQGCPWDREQTLSSMRAAILEEAYELVEAIDTANTANLVEEIGDLLFVTCFVGYLAQQDGVTSLEEILTSVKNKLIHRHPHVFNEKTDISVDGVLSNWEKIKAKEKNASHHPLKSIPKSLPELQRLYKILSKMKRLNFLWKLDHLHSVTKEVEKVVRHNPQLFFKGFLLYAFEQGIDLTAVVRELSSELIEQFDREKKDSSE